MLKEEWERTIAEVISPRAVVAIRLRVALRLLALLLALTLSLTRRTALTLTAQAALLSPPLPPLPDSPLPPQIRRHRRRADLLDLLLPARLLDLRCRQTGLQALLARAQLLALSAQRLEATRLGLGELVLERSDHLVRLLDVGLSAIDALDRDLCATDAAVEQV
eukprot:scaffold15348_cov38-Phaeocystis_antarctica.AAC.1